MQLRAGITGHLCGARPVVPVLRPLVGPYKVPAVPCSRRSTRTGAGFLDEPIECRVPSNPDPSLINAGALAAVMPSVQVACTHSITQPLVDGPAVPFCDFMGMFQLALVVHCVPRFCTHADGREALGHARLCKLLGDTGKTCSLIKELLTQVTVPLQPW